VIPLYIPIENQENLINPEDEPEELRNWRATGTVRQIPPTVVGRMVHKALQCWCLPGHLNLPSLLETTARNEGIAQTEQLETVIQEATQLLTRFSKHPIRQEIESALECYHEVPYTYVAGKYAESGYIDLLYRTPAGWQIIDFKTDAIHSNQQRSALKTEYQKQLIRYKNAVTKLLNTIPHTRICFLDDQGEVSLMPMNSNF
jgi:ATP-dependent exoDNAse (exonuclease V) beta subunit